MKNLIRTKIYRRKLRKMYLAELKKGASPEIALDTAKRETACLIAINHMSTWKELLDFIWESIDN